MGWKRVRRVLLDFSSFAKSNRFNLTSPKIFGKAPWDWIVSVFLPVAAVTVVFAEIDSNKRVTLREIEANRKALQESLEVQKQFNQQQTLQNYLS